VSKSAPPLLCAADVLVGPKVRSWTRVIGQFGADKHQGQQIETSGRKVASCNCPNDL
jgi:hypothetical protein